MNAEERWLLVAIASLVLIMVGTAYYFDRHPEHTHCVARMSGEVDCWIDRGTEPHVE